MVTWEWVWSRGNGCGHMGMRCDDFGNWRREDAGY